MPSEQNKTAVLRLLDQVFARGNSAAFLEELAPDVVLHLSGYPEPFRGSDAVKRWADEYLSAFDVQLTVNDTMAVGEDVVARWTIRATHRAEYAGIPRTGREVTFTALEWFHFQDGKAVEIWNTFDALEVVQQLGVIPRGGPPKPLLRLMFTLQSLRRRTAGRSRG